MKIRYVNGERYKQFSPASQEAQKDIPFLNASKAWEIKLDSYSARILAF